MRKENKDALRLLQLESEVKALKAENAALKAKNAEHVEAIEAWEARVVELEKEKQRDVF